MNRLKLYNKTGLFKGIEELDMEAILPCLNARVKTFKKGEILLYVGDYVSNIGIVLSGFVQVERMDIWGNRYIVDKLGAGQTFAETFATAGEPLTVSVMAASDVDVMWIDTDRILSVCSSACSFHKTLIENLLRIIAKKNLVLSIKTSYLTIKSIRGRLLAYFSTVAERDGKSAFDIPFNRQELADYLSVERSALCNELSKMQRDGLIEYQKNRFKIKTDTVLSK